MNEEEEEDTKAYNTATSAPAKERMSLSWSQSIDGYGGAAAEKANNNHNHSQEPSQTQTEVLTQNPDNLTQLGDFEDEQLSPLPPYSPTCNPLHMPWGRLMPCSLHAPKGIELFPRPPPSSDTASTSTSNTTASSASSTSNGVTFLGMPHIRPSDIFNEYVLGRSHKCDILALKPSSSSNDDNDNDNNDNNTGANDKEKARQDWAYGMISNKHAKLYCCLESTTTANAYLNNNMAVFIEDMSNNGTIVNKTTLLRRGEKRLLHSGDEICLVNPQTLRKKIRSNATLQKLLQQHSYVFVNVLQQQVAAFPSLHAAVTGQQQQQQQQPSSRLSSDSFPVPASLNNKRKAAVDVRATRTHSHKAPTPSSSSSSSCASSSRNQQQAATTSSFSQFSNTNNNRRISPRRQQQQQPPPRRLRRIEEDYDIRDLLGSGTVGQVRRAIDRKTGQERAVKIIARNNNTAAFSFNNNNNNNSATFEAEASILQGLEHPYVVKLLDFYVTPTAVYLVMELLQGGDLFDRIVQKGKYTEVECRRVMRRLLSAIYYLHEERQIVHRDLKPENILLLSNDSDVEIKLTDFGLAKTVSGDGLKTFCGTPLYFAPEILMRRHTVLGRGRYGKQADMWSLGIILYVLLSGTPPFDVGEQLDMDVYSSSVNNANANNNNTAASMIDFPDEHWAGVSEAAKNLVRQLLVLDPKSRMTVRDACQHEWILQDDGDTHRHPLDDPKLLLVSQKKRRRLFVENDGNNCQDSPRKDGTAVVANESECDDTKAAGVAQATAVERETSKEDGDTHRHPIDNPKLCVSQKQGLAVGEDAALMNDDNDDDKVVVVNESLECGDTKAAQVAVAETETPDSLQVGTLLAQADDSIDCRNDSCEEQDCNSKPRGPLSPVSLNERQKEFRNQVLASAAEDTTAKRNHHDTNSTSSPRNDTALAPEPSSNDSVTDAKDSTGKEKAEGELTDDEISQFSEQTESISSFGTSFDDANMTGKGETGEKQKTEQEEPDQTTTTRPKKRRVTDSIGNSKLTPPKSNKTPKKVNGASQQKTSNKTKTLSSVAKKNRKTKKAEPKLEGGTRRKQMTLSNWVTKPN